MEQEEVAYLAALNTEESQPRLIFQEESATYTEVEVE